VTPEARARHGINQLLTAAGWHVCDYKQVNLSASRGVAIREFPLNEEFGTAGYLPSVDGKAAGVIDAERHATLLADMLHPYRVRIVSPSCSPAEFGVV
jgi:type I restriction enzyme R subunit